MKPASITKAEVQTVISDLKNAGEKATVRNIHAALGGSASMTTVLKFKREIDAQTEPLVQDSEPGLATFRQLWSLAVDEGRGQRQAEVAEMQETIEALMQDAERLEALTTSSAARLAESERQREDLTKRLAAALQDVATAQAAGQGHAAAAAEAFQKMATLQTDANKALREAQDNSSRTIGALREELHEAREKLHAATIDKANLRGQLTAAQAEISARMTDQENTARRAELAETRVFELIKATPLATQPTPSNAAESRASEPPAPLASKNAQARAATPVSPVAQRGKAPRKNMSTSGADNGS